MWNFSVLGTDANQTLMSAPAIRETLADAVSAPNSALRVQIQTDPRA
jgi:hypothetical protein